MLIWGSNLVNLINLINLSTFNQLTGLIIVERLLTLSTERKSKYYKKTYNHKCPSLTSQEKM